MKKICNTCGELYEVETKQGDFGECLLCWKAYLDNEARQEENSYEDYN